jgi:hypothetical protein
LVSLAQQDGTHPILNFWHDYMAIQADSPFYGFRAPFFALEIGVATDTSKFAAQNVQLSKVRTK